MILKIKMVSKLFTFLLLVCGTSAQSTTKGKPLVCVETNYKSLLTMDTKLDTVISLLKTEKTATMADNDVGYVDCKHILDSGVSTGSGVYTIYNPVDPLQKREVYCDMDTEGGGWLVLQRRVSDSVDFNRVWSEYVSGFGDVTGNFWLGNELLHRLTYYKPQELKVELENFENMTAYAKYQEFRVDSGTNKYKLSVSGYSGSAGDSLNYHNGANFCTKDRDYDTSTMHCAKALQGAWWFKSCEDSSLNGPYYLTETIDPYHYHGISWDTFGGDKEASLKMSEMKIRPI